MERYFIPSKSLRDHTARLIVDRLRSIINNYHGSVYPKDDPSDSLIIEIPFMAKEIKEIESILKAF